MLFFFLFKQKTAYEMRISDWSSDVCSSDLALPAQWRRAGAVAQHESCRLGAVAARQSRRFGTSSLGNLYIPMRGAPAQAHPQGAVHHSLACLATEPDDSPRSEARRVGKECVSPCRARWWTDPKKKKK